MNVLELSSRQVIGAYLRHLSRAIHPAGTLGRDPDQSPSTAPSSGDWEQLIHLMKGAEDEGLKAWALYILGWDGHYTGQRVADWGRQSDPLANTSWDEGAATSLTWFAVARRMGITVKHVRKLARQVEEQVAYNLGRARRHGD